ncbi:Lsr2 family protein [Aquipuribacter hungaricus]|uniref:Lsr2 family protein n=1 Tax=Aquipuribacter hungaricus TaxID=545624 RepID=A0ABV7WMA7_9MICO
MNVVLVDDIDGSPAVETVTFALDGVSYEIDLSEANASRLRSSVAEFVENGRRAGGNRGRGARASSKPSGSSAGADNATVREWARANGHPVSDRGRIKAEVMAAYTAANS